MDLLKTILAVIGALVLAVLFKRYTDGQKAKAELKRRELDDEIQKAISRNNDTSLDDLIKRENERIRK